MGSGSLKASWFEEPPTDGHDSSVSPRVRARLADERGVARGDRCPTLGDVATAVGADFCTYAALRHAWPNWCSPFARVGRVARSGARDARSSGPFAPRSRSPNVKSSHRHPPQRRTQVIPWRASAPKLPSAESRTRDGAARRGPAALRRRPGASRSARSGSGTAR